MLRWSLMVSGCKTFSCGQCTAVAPAAAAGSCQRLQLAETCLMNMCAELSEASEQSEMVELEFTRRRRGSAEEHLVKGIIWCLTEPPHRELETLSRLEFGEAEEQCGPSSRGDCLSALNLSLVKSSSVIRTAALTERFCFSQHYSCQLLTEVWSECYSSSSTCGSVVTYSVCRKFNFRGEPSRKQPCSYKYCIQE